MLEVINLGRTSRGEVGVVWRLAALGKQRRSRKAFLNQACHRSAMAVFREVVGVPAAILEGDGPN